MAKKIIGFIKLQVPAGKANPSPPIGPALGQRGLNIMEFCKAFNAQTQGMEPGLPIPVVITDSQNAFTTNVTVTTSTLTADRTLAGTTYQWLDCDNNNAPINGATSQVFTPTQDGNYAVQLTTNGCISVSNCYPFSTLMTSYFNWENEIKVYPNPTNGQIVINGQVDVQSVEIYNVLGELINNKADLSGFSSGLYFLKIKTSQGTTIRKIIK